MSLLTKPVKSVLRVAPDWMERAIRGSERALTPREFMKMKEVTPPKRVENIEEAWALKTKEQPPYVSLSVQPYDRGQIDHFISGGKTDNISISPGKNFRGIDLNVLDTPYVDSFEVEAVFKTAKGSKIEKTRKLTSGSFFSARYVPVRFTIAEPAERVEVSLESEISSPKWRELLFKITHRSDWKESPDPCLTVPTPRSRGGTPIVLISVDTFRYDYLHTFQPVLAELGEAATVPEEPRTQGYCTQPSHGSMFAGVHPTVHGNFGSKPTSAGYSTGIDPTLETIPELLDRHLYKCSGCGSEEKIGPINGFGDGMDRFRHYPISWDDRVFDASDIANAIIEWIRTDAKAPSKRLFYFLHFFDPHYPYIPPQPEQIEQGLDYELADRIRKKASQRDYLAVLNGDPVDLPDNDIESLKENYEASLRYTAFQIRRIIQELKRAELFEDAFIIITGDHGEEFFERKFWGHSTLYDANIRPGMILKPPQDSSISVRDNVDLIDIFPTIAELVEGKVPDSCQGAPLQSSHSGPRITERHGPTYYSVAVEKDGIKGIFTYDYEFPGRPTPDQVTDGPRETEFYRLTEVRAGEDGGAIDPDAREGLQSLAESFVLNTETIESDYDMSRSMPKDVEARLEQLGYK